MDNESNAEQTDIVGNANNVKQKHWTDDREETGMRIKGILNPMLYGIAMAGCYNFSDISSAGQTSTGTSTTSPMKSMLSNFYRLIFLFIILLYLSKQLAAFWYLPTEDFLFNGLLSIWLTSNLCIYLIMVKATSTKYGHYEEVFQFWDQKIAPQFRELGIEYPVLKMKKQVLIVLIISLILVFFNVAGIAVLIEINKASGEIYTAPFESNTTSMLVFFIFHTALSCIWIMPTAFVITFSKLLQESFEVLNASGLKTCQQNAGRIHANFNQMRLLHLNLSTLVRNLDQDFSWYYAICYMFGIGLNVFILYQIMLTSMSMFQLVLFLFWFLSGLACVGLTATHAAFLHEAVSIFLIHSFNAL